MPSRIPLFKPPRVPVRRREDRPNAYQRGYCDAAHKAWRAAVLTRDAWQCRECGRVCDDKREAHADHVVPIADGGGRYDVSNGQCLCVRCHGAKTRREQNAKGGGARRDGAR